MVELPDDAIEALVQAAEHAYEYTPYDEMAEHAWPNVVRAVYPLIAARAEALREAAEKIAPNQVRPSNVIVVGARMTDDVLDMVRTVEDALVAAVRAEAVAGERQRMLDGANPARAQAIREVENYVGPNLAGWPAFPGVYFGGLVDRVISAYALAADPVPVATRLQPERVGFGTDAFEVGGSLPGQPVPTPITPGRVTCRHCGYFVDSDAHERTCGRVATPTEPDGAALITTERRRQVEVEGWTHEHDGRHRRESLALAAAAYATPQDKRAYREVGECIVPAWWPWAPEWWKPTPSDRVRELVKAGALIAAEIDRLRAASPVPAEQPPTCEHGRTTKHVYGSPDESDYGLCPGPAEQPEER